MQTPVLFSPVKKQAIASRVARSGLPVTQFTLFAEVLLGTRIAAGALSLPAKEARTGRQ